MGETESYILLAVSPRPVCGGLSIQIVGHTALIYFLLTKQFTDATDKNGKVQHHQ